MHAEYSSCMYKIHQWNRQHANAARLFVDIMEDVQENMQEDVDTFKQKYSSNLHAQAAEINRCRSLTKDFWRLALTYIEVADGSSSDYRSRHQRFVIDVKPIDQLPGYESESDPVYNFPTSK